MVKTAYVLLVSAIIMLAASVVVIIVAVIFHPSNSKAARQLAELKPKLEKALCEAGINTDEDVCQKYFSREKEIPEGKPDCTLTKARKDKIGKTVSQVLSNDMVLRDNLKILAEVTRHDQDKAKIVKKIRNLSLYAPKPSAHWYLNGQPDVVKGMGNIKRNISKWTYENGNEIAHTLHGIKHYKDGKMLIPVDGWYNIYVQMDFQTNITKEKDMAFGVTVMITSGKESEKLSIIQDQRVVTCPAKGHHKFHTCAVLNKGGLYKLAKDDLLVVEVNMPNDPRQVQVTQHWSRSYFGVNFVTNYMYLK